MSAEKALLRAKMRGIAGERGDSTTLSADLSRHLRHWPLWQSSAMIAAFSPLAGEPDALHPWPVEKRIALPLVMGSGLKFRWVGSPEELQPGQFGILEPAKDAPCAGSTFDLILVPGLAFDRRGGRLGRGKGYYDRFLCETTGLRAGIGFEDQIVEEIPCEAHDVRVDFLITPAGIFPCAP